jgi:hypothetical protein
MYMFVQSATQSTDIPLLPLDRRDRRKWIEDAFNLCVHLAEVRQHTTQMGFVKWCRENGFGEDVINRGTRLAAVTMGREPEALRACLEATARRSLEAIHQVEWKRPQARRLPNQRNYELYRHFDADGKLLYVGRALNALERLTVHRDNAPWYYEITTVTIERFATYRELLDAEQVAIRRENPRHNVQYASSVAEVNYNA